jgi:hypothetical protein
LTWYGLVAAESGLGSPQADGKGAGRQRENPLLLTADKERGVLRGMFWRRIANCGAQGAVTFFHLFLAASSGASNCDVRIGVAAAEMYPT